MLNARVLPLLGEIGHLPQVDLLTRSAGTVFHIETANRRFVAQLKELQGEDGEDRIWLAEFHHGIRRIQAVSLATSRPTNLFGLRGSTRGYTRTVLSELIEESADAVGFPGLLVQGLRLELTLPDFPRKQLDGTTTYPTLPLGQIVNVYEGGQPLFSN